MSKQLVLSSLRLCPGQVGKCSFSTKPLVREVVYPTFNLANKYTPLRLFWQSDGTVHLSHSHEPACDITQCLQQSARWMLS